MVKVTVLSDYDGFFEQLVKYALNQVKDCKWEEVVITSGPWRSYGMEAKHQDGVLYLDFYSALRNGFGKLDPEDVKSVLEVKK